MDKLDQEIGKLFIEYNDMMEMQQRIINSSAATAAEKKEADGKRATLIVMFISDMRAVFEENKTKTPEELVWKHS
jgi:ATP phosphoribosyltransferase